MTALMFALSVGAQAQTAPPLKLEKTIPLEHVTGRIDHMDLDVTGQRLFVSALGNNTLEVLDLKVGKQVRSISGCSEPQGVVYVRNRNQLFVANGGSGKVDVFDSRSFKLLKSFGDMPDADDARYDSQAGMVYIAYGKGALAVIRTGTLEKVGEIKTAAHPEAFAVEPDGNRIFINEPDAREVEMAARRQQKVITRWPMRNFGGNFPMALDEKDHRLFVGCRRHARLIVFNATKGEPVANLALSGDNDDMYYDAARHRIYASCGEGFVDVFAQQDANHYQRIAHIPTASGARTSYYSPELNEFFLAVPRRWNQKAEIRVFKVE